MRRSAMPKALARWVASMSVSTKEPGSSSASTRSRAVSLPFSCWTSTALSEPAWSACSLRWRSSAIRSFIDLGCGGATTTNLPAGDRSRALCLVRGEGGGRSGAAGEVAAPEPAQAGGGERRGRGQQPDQRGRGHGGPGDLGDVAERGEGQQPLAEPPQR